MGLYEQELLCEFLGMAKKYWLMKTEPSVFSFDDLTKSPKKSTCWEGVRNYQARNLMRDEMKKGDQVLFYHSRTDDPAVAGVAEVCREAYEDNTAFDSKSKYFDGKAKARGTNPWVMVDVKATHRLEQPVGRSLMKKEAALKKMVVLQKGSRLSVQPVQPDEFKHVLKLGKPKKL